MLLHGLKPHLVDVGSTLATGQWNEALQALELSQIQVGREHGDHEESSLRVFRSRALKNWTLFCSKLMIPRWPGSSLRVQDAWARKCIQPQEPTSLKKRVIVKRCVMDIYSVVMITHVHAAPVSWDVLGCLGRCRMMQMHISSPIKLYIYRYYMGAAYQ